MVYIILIVISFLLDQLTKAYYYRVYDRSIVKGFLSFNYIENDGAAYGMLGDFKYAQLLFAILTVVFLIALFFFYAFTKKKSKWLHTSLAFVVGGTLGNFVDRISFSYVRDFLQVRNPFNLGFFNFMNFTCNVADIFLCVGAAMLVIYILFMDADALFRKKQKPEDLQNADKMLDEPAAK